MRIGGRIPRRDGAFTQRFLRIRHYPGHVSRYDIAEAFALGAGAERSVEIEKLWFRVGVIYAAVVATQVAAVDEVLPRSTINRDQRCARRIRSCRGVGQHIASSMTGIECELQR